MNSCYAEMDKRREEEQEEFEKITAANFETIKAKVEAEKEIIRNTTDVQTTRENLKKLQNLFVTFLHLIDEILKNHQN